MQGSLAHILLQPLPLLMASVVLVSLVAFASRPARQALLLNPYRVRTKGEVYRLLTAGWVHGDAQHLIFNLFSLYFFAEDTIRVLGVTRFFVLYLSAVIVAFIPTTIRHRNNPKYNSVGASGAVAAVMFSAVLLYPKMKLMLMMLPIPVPGIIYALCYLAYSAYRSFVGNDEINHDAHFAGAIYGALLTYLFEPARVERTLRNFF